MDKYFISVKIMFGGNLVTLQILVSPFENDLRLTQTGRDSVTRRDFSVFESTLNRARKYIFKALEPSGLRCLVAANFGNMSSGAIKFASEN